MRSRFFPVACVLLGALPALGQSTYGSESKTTMRASNLLGATIVQGKSTLGRVSDMTFNDKGAILDLIVRTDSNVLFALSFSAVRYDSDQRAYAISFDVPPRIIGTVREPAAAPVASTSERWVRSGRLIRNDPPPAARIEREQPAYDSPPQDHMDAQYRDLAAAARRYDEPIGSVSLTRNINRLPRRGEPYDNYTTYSEMTGRRSFYKVPPPPTYAR